jgi:hypothetical protein
VLQEVQAMLPARFRAGPADTSVSCKVSGLHDQDMQALTGS